MKTSTHRLSRAVVRALFVVALCPEVLGAANLLSATPGSVSLTCNTASGPGAAATIVIKPVATLISNTIAVTATLASGLTLTPPATTVLSSGNQTQGLTYTVSTAAGCAGATSGSSVVRFYAGGMADVTVTVTTSVVSTVSPLAASPVVLTCTRSGGSTVVYAPGPAQTVSVVSAAAGGTPFTVNSAANPSWLSATPARGVANATGASLTVAVLSPCGGYPGGSSNSASIHLANPPAPDAVIPVTLQIIGPSPLSAAPATAGVSYTKGSTTAGFVDVALSAASGTPSFKVDPSSLPVWLAVDAAAGTVPATIRFSTTKAAASLAAGNYSATIQIESAGSADLALPIRLSVNDAPPTLSVVEGTTRNFTWTMGQPLPIPHITLLSSGAAIAYSISTDGSLAPIISSGFLKGLAYSYSTPIPVTFDPLVFQAAPAGSVLSGTVRVTWGTPATTTVVTINVTIQPAAATLQSIVPSVVPTAAAGQAITFALSGSGFVASSDPAQTTVVGIVSGGSLVADKNLAVTVSNSSNILVTITVPASADRLLPFSPSGPGGTVTLGVCNPTGGNCKAPTGTATLTITTNPTIQAITSASSFVTALPPALPQVAPYDIISLFGFHFCTSRGTGCGGTVLYGLPDSATLRYPAQLSPDPAGASQRQLTVTFQSHETSPAPIGNASLLFATDGQINLVAPVGLNAYIGKTVDVVVNFGTVSSAPFSVAAVSTDPGLFAVGADGQGDGAILGADWSVIGVGNEAGVRQVATDSDTVQIFATGLGEPDGRADDSVPGAGLWPQDCVSESSFLKSLNKLTSGSSTTLDGTLAAGAALATGRLGPCLSMAVPTVTVGGQPATVTYAGWVPNSIVGAYQINARLPGSAGPFTVASGQVVSGPLTSAVQLPVTINAGGRSSQAGVTIWVAPRLKMIAPSSAALKGAEGTPWATAGNLVAAGEGKAPYQYTVTVGSLPAGLALNTATGAITGTPAAGSAGSYPITVTASDSSATPLTGNATFSLSVAAGH